jgi:pyrroloquinoline-quinone synthase
MNLNELNNRLDQLHLLNHPFYVAWERGELTQEILQDYAEQYYQHIKAFPRYISATHSMCEDIEKRKILLDNLSDEENLNKDHPMLWKQFALAAGADESSLDLVKQEYFTSDLIENFFRLSRSSYAEGLGALYAYEERDKRKKFSIKSEVKYSCFTRSKLLSSAPAANANCFQSIG